MRLFRNWTLAFVAWVMLAAGQAAAEEKRVALVIGEAAYASKPLATAASDAGLVAQTLQAAGFDVTGARDLAEEELKRAFRDFLDKAAGAGSDAVAFVYFSGYGLQLEGENYLVPIDAKINRDADIPMRALRVSDYLKPLAASGAKLSIVVLDAARPSPFQISGQPLAGGLALFEPGAKALLAFNAAPGTVAAEEKGAYGAYAQALSEMIRDGGRPLMDVFEKTRLRVADETKGAQIPWNSSKVETGFVFFQRTAGAPPLTDVDGERLGKPISALGPKDGYAAALERDTLQGYEDYVASYPSAPSAKRVQAILAARREALTWRRTRVVDTPNAYWSYLRRYPKGPHAWDSRRRLAQLSQAAEPPASFEAIEYDYAPPPAEEIVYVERPVIVFDDPAYGFEPPPPAPVYLLPPPPPDFIALPPPIVVAEPYVLPVPVYVPVPVWQRPPVYVAPPPDNFIYANMHNTVVVDKETNNVVARNRQGQVVSTGALAAAGAGTAAVAVGAALPHFIAKRQAIAPQPAGPGAPPLGAQAPSGPAGAPQGPGRPGPGRPAETPFGGKPGIAPPGGAVPPAPGAPGPKDHALPKPLEGKQPAPATGAVSPPPAAGKPGAPAPGAATAPPAGQPAGKERELPKAPAPAGTPGGAKPPGETATPPTGEAAPKDHALPKPPAAKTEPGKAVAPPAGGPKARALPAPGGGAPEAAPPQKRALPSGRLERRGPAAPSTRAAPGLAGPKPDRPKAAAPAPQRPFAPPGLEGGPRGAPRRSLEGLPGPAPQPFRAPAPRLRETPAMQQPRLREPSPAMRGPAPIDRGPPAGMIHRPPVAAPSPQIAPMMRQAAPPPPRQPGAGAPGAPGAGFGGAKGFQ